MSNLPLLSRFNFHVSFGSFVGSTLSRTYSSTYITLTTVSQNALSKLVVNVTKMFFGSQTPLTLDTNQNTIFFIEIAKIDHF